MQEKKDQLVPADGYAKTVNMPPRYGMSQPSVEEISKMNNVSIGLVSPDQEEVPVQEFTEEELRTIKTAELKRSIKITRMKIRAGFTKNNGVGLSKDKRKQAKESRRKNR